MSGWDDLRELGAVVRPISTWPGGEAAAEYRMTPFSAGWSDTTNLLAYELAKLSATQVVIELAIGESDLRIDGMPRARAIASHPGVIVSFDSAHGPLRYATARYSTWQANVRAIGLALEALRKVSRYGIGSDGEQYRGWRQLHSGADDEATIERGRALIRDAGSVAEALRMTHPDTRENGASDVEFRSVMLAREAGVS